MKQVTVLAVVLLSAFVATSLANNDYLWGEIGPNDVLIATDNVKKMAALGLVQTSKYTFKQKNNFDALTITAVRITDRKRKNGATATLVSGGPGSKGVTLKFRSKRGSGIKNTVEIWGR